MVCRLPGCPSLAVLGAQWVDFRRPASPADAPVSNEIETGDDEEFGHIFQGQPQVVHDLRARCGQGLEPHGGVDDPQFGASDNGRVHSAGRGLGHQGGSAVWRRDHSEVAECVVLPQVPKARSPGHRGRSDPPVAAEE
jgi:hypothetical protein